MYAEMGYIDTIIPSLLESKKNLQKLFVHACKVNEPTLMKDYIDENISLDIVIQSFPGLKKDLNKLIKNNGDYNSEHQILLNIFYSAYKNQKVGEIDLTQHKVLKMHYDNLVKIFNK